MSRVKGIGGIFIRSSNPKTTKEWYARHLGLNMDAWGTNFEWRLTDKPESKAFTQWSLIDAHDTRVIPKGASFVINYRVENLVELVEQLRGEGVNVIDTIQEFSYGKFVHIEDIEGNKIELWEANDIEYERIVEGRTY
jgi:predicted enzyme related to lactoylglutathione lyase